MIAFLILKIAIQISSSMSRETSLFSDGAVSFDLESGQ